MHDLAPRIVTGSILGVVVVGGVLWLPYAVMASLFLVVLFLAALEWAHLAGFESRASRIAYACATVALAAVAGLRASPFSGEAPGVLGLACLWWLVATAWVLGYQWRERPQVRQPWVVAACGWLALVPALVAVLQLLGRPSALLALFALVWSADILAYFGGRRLGRRRLASRVSPGKTWEGLAVALVGTLALVAVVAVWGRAGPLPFALALAALTVVAAVIGDLLESLLKRLRGVKDSGKLLPGHGGVLDRIDSVLAAAPVFALGCLLMERP